MPPKKAQADSSPAITSSKVWPKVGQRKQCLEWPRTSSRPHTVRRRPVPGSWTSPSRPKSISATSPGGVSSIRTVAALRRLRQLRRATKRCREVYDTRQPRSPSNSWMRVSSMRSPVSHR